MKAILTVSAMIMMLGAAVSVSAMPMHTVKSSDHTCDQLKMMVAHHGGIKVKGPFGTDTYFADAATCNSMPDYESNFAYVKSSDKSLCGIGYACQYRPKGG